MNRLAASTREQSYFIRVMAFVLIVLLMCSQLVTVAYATDTSSDNGTDVSDSEIESFVTAACKVQGGKVVIKDSKVKAWLHDSDTGIDSPTTVVVTVDGTTATFYASASSMKALQKYITDKKASDKVTDKINGMTEGFSMEADTDGAAIMMGGFEGVASIIAGIVLYFVVLMMGIYAAFDVAFIAFPLFRVKCDEAQQSGGNNMMTKQSSSGETTLRWVTEEAQAAVKMSASTGKSPWWFWIKKKVTAYIMVGIIVFMLATGQMDLFVRIALRWVSGIIEALSGLAA